MKVRTEESSPKCSKMASLRKGTVAISCAARHGSRRFSVLWDEQLYPEQKRAPCPRVTPWPADLLISSPTTKNLPECSPPTGCPCRTSPEKAEAPKFNRCLSHVSTPDPTFSLRRSWVPGSVAVFLSELRAERVGSRVLGEDFCQGLWGREAW